MTASPGSDASAGLPLRDRRWAALARLLQDEGLDALLIAGNDQPGQKGALRWAADYWLYYRYGFVLVTPQEAPVLVLPANFTDDVGSPWMTRRMHVAQPAAEVARRIAALPRRQRIGVVGLGNGAFTARDHQILSGSLPGARLIDCAAAFERLREVKSPEELDSLARTAAIADRCFERLLELARPGITERAIGAEMLDLCQREGGDDPLFLCMGLQDDGAGTRPFMGAPRDRPLETGEPFVFSFEMVGPGGHWVELARAVMLGEADAPAAAAAQAVIACIESARRALVPGETAGGVFEAAAAALDPGRYRLGKVIGHSIGLDVVEMPMLSGGDGGAVASGMAFAVHPRIAGTRESVHAYAADTFVVDESGARRLSRWPLQIYELPAAASA